MPATNLLFYVGFVVAERVLYLPSVGYCLLVGLGISKVKRTRYWRISWAALVLLLCLFAARTMLRNRDWKDEEMLYRSAIPVNPPKGNSF